MVDYEIRKKGVKVANCYIAGLVAQEQMKLAAGNTSLGPMPKLRCGGRANPKIWGQRQQWKPGPGPQQYQKVWGGRKPLCLFYIIFEWFWPRILLLAFAPHLILWLALAPKWKWCYASHIFSQGFIVTSMIVVVTTCRNRDYMCIEVSCESFHWNCVSNFACCHIRTCTLILFLRRRAAPHWTSDHPLCFKNWLPARKSVEKVDREACHKWLRCVRLLNVLTKNLCFPYGVCGFLYITNIKCELEAL